MRPEIRSFRNHKLDTKIEGNKIDKPQTDLPGFQSGVKILSQCPAHFVFYVIKSCASRQLSELHHIRNIEWDTKIERNKINESQNLTKFQSGVKLIKILSGFERRYKS